MNPEQIIASVNKENSELQGQNRQLRNEIQKLEQQLFEVYTLNSAFEATFQAQAFEICRATETINGLHQHVHFLQSYIARVGHQSDQGMLACQQTAKYFERQNAENWSSHQWSREAASLSNEARDLEKAVLIKIEASNPSDEQTRQLIDKILKIESNILLKEIQNNDLNRTLRDKKDRLDEVIIKTSAMIAARDDLNRRLVATNKRIQIEAGTNARALTMAQNAKVHLEQELADAEVALRKHEETKKQLDEIIQKEERLQVKHQAALAEAEGLRLSTAFYKGEDSNQVKTITSLQRQVIALQDAERRSGYTKTINDQKMEIAQLVSNQARLEEQLRKNNCIVTKSLAMMVEQTKLVREAEKEAATNRGHALGTARSLLDSLAKTNTDLAKQIVDTVFTMLKDLDSEPKARV